MSSTIKVALLGFGTVGKGVYDSVETHQGRLQSILGKRVEIVGILVKDVMKQRDIDSNILVCSDIEQILQIPNLDVVLEAIVGVDTGYDYLSRAMDKGIHVITANKELLAHKGRELRQKAEEQGVRLEYEAAVAGGIPIISTLKHLLKVNSIVRIEAILNGTSNYILSDIRENKSLFRDALIQAQEKGYAEANPSNDIDGWDAFYKLMVLSEFVYGAQPAWNQVAHRGIRDVDLTHIVAADSFGYRLKHVASIEYQDGVVKAAIEPKFVPSSHPLYSVEGVDNAVIITGDLIGKLSLQGPGAGALPTASAIIEDLVNVFQVSDRKTLHPDVTFETTTGKEVQEWLLIGNLLDSDSIIIHQQKEIDGICSSRVSGEEHEIRKLIETSSNLSGYRIEGVEPKSKEALVV
ncbi:homoserine dehydrogenase [Aquibacillus halophilus]|uniref:Homoserine dehydrogenase n=1 Tax=Aquibacillus halophilus TaxID=930132 RepID=A0A6A8DBW9_9BACI|nr:homoserine dehydrogenase [Aquibacillus halophilus]MRH42026.1 homoserine dehydrogenase [Aquibacillus halophilus]